MFQKAQIKLTVSYSILFLLLFWTFSSGLYVWMNNSFGEGYISRVEHRQNNSEWDTLNKNTHVVTIAGDVAMDQLRDTLILLNLGLLFIVPIISWFLAKRTLAPMKKIHERQKQFVSDASHEMRTPLSIITGEIDVTLTKKRTSHDYKRTLESTREEINRLARLVQNLLFLAKDDQKAHTLLFEPVDITDIINEVTQALQIKSKQKYIPITLLVGDFSNAPAVKGDSVLLRQLFYNLLDNAITYTPKSGKITISLSESKDSVVVAMEDTGIGIAKQDLEKILRRFHRVDTSRSQTKGYGLGLAIAKAIVENHNGRLLITSKIKEGSTFTIVLPKL